MGNSKKKVKIMVDLNYSIIICMILAIVMVVILILPFIAFEPPHNFFKIIWVLISAFFALISTTGAILSYQIAILDENGITFRSVIREIAKVKWSDIVKVDIQDVVTLHSTLKSFKIKWIVLYTALNQEVKYGGGNKKDNPPWRIKYNKKSVETLKNYLKKYSNIISKIEW